MMLVTLQAEAIGETFETSTNMDPYSVRTKLQEIPSFPVYYTSYDGQKNKVQLSATVYYPMDEIGLLDTEKFEGPIYNIYLACHPTVTSNDEAPSGYNAVDNKVSYLAGVNDNHSIVIFPDYCGYGVSNHLQHPYLIHDVTARNCIDAVMAVFKELDERKWDYSKARTHIVGYSQGGATALACTKYLESAACPDSVKEKVKLYETACGDGPYSTLATVKQYLEWGKPLDVNPEGDQDLEYSCVLPLIVAAAKDAYGEGCMRTVEVKDYFTEEFLSSGVLDLINSKGAGTDVLAKAIANVMKRQRPVDVFSDKIINKETGEFNTDTKEYKCLMRALELGELTIGWEPKHPIYVYHIPSDKVVPYANKEEIFKEGHIGGEEHNGLVQYITPEEANENINPLIPLVEDAVKDPNFNFTNHATGGVIFYADYMYGDALREVYVKGGYKIFGYVISETELRKGIPQIE